MSRLDEKSEASIASLVDCACRRFGADGYEGISLVAVAAETGFTKGAVYHHFGSKRGLFEAVFRREQRALVLRVAEGSRGATDVIDALVRGVRTYFDAVLDPGLRQILLIDGPAVLGWEEWHRCEEPGFRSLLRTTLQTAQTEGRLRKAVHTGDAAEMLLGALTGCALALAEADEPSKQAKRYVRAFGTHLEGLLIGQETERSTSR